MRAHRYGRLMRVLSGDQRAVGERLICTAPNGRDCIGYAEFCDLLVKEPERVRNWRSSATTWSSCRRCPIPRRSG